MPPKTPLNVPGDKGRSSILLRLSTTATANKMSATNHWPFVKRSLRSSRTSHTDHRIRTPPPLCESIFGGNAVNKLSSRCFCFRCLQRKNCLYDESRVESFIQLIQMHADNAAVGIIELIRRWTSMLIPRRLWPAQEPSSPSTS